MKVLSVSYDFLSKVMGISKINLSKVSGDPAAGTNPTYTDVTTSRYYYPAVFLYNTEAVTLNTGIKPFTYKQPSGFIGVFK